MGARHFPLPPYAHRPGDNPRPDEALFEAVKAACPAVTCDAEAAANPAWRHGLRLFNAGYFWEAHEVLEPVWMKAPPNSRERHLVQAVIHLANGALKLRMGRPRAAARLAALARESLERAFTGGSARLLGLDRGGLEAAAAAIAGGSADIRLRPWYAR